MEEEGALASEEDVGGKINKSPKGFVKSYLQEVLLESSFFPQCPGVFFYKNIRELENIIEHGFVLCRGSIITINHLPQELRENRDRSKEKTSSKTFPLKDAERRIILEALRKHNGNRRDTAHELNIDKSTLRRKMKKLGIEF